MRLSVTYKVSRIPVAYRFVVLSFIKEALNQADSGYYHMLYVENEGKMKPFCTAVYLKDFTYQQDEIHLTSLTINIAAADMTFMLHLFNGLQRLTSYTTPYGVWERTHIQMLQETEIHSDHVHFSTLSPILIEDKQGNPVHPDQVEYATEFGYYAALRIRELTGREPYRPILFQPLTMKRVVIKETNSTFRRSNTESKQLHFTAYRGQFILQGHPADLQFLYQSGVGKRASQSFGMLQYVKEG